MCRHSVESRALTCPCKQHNLSAWSHEPWIFFFCVEKESNKEDFAIRAIKFTFHGDRACKEARRILEDKNKALKHANPTGQFPTAITMQLTDGTPMRTTEDKLRKVFIKVPFLFFSEYSLFSTHNISHVRDNTNARCKSAHKTIAHTHPPLTAPPPLGCNNTTSQCLTCLRN